MSSSEQPGLSSHTACGLEMDVRACCGHLPFCASVAWASCWPGLGTVLLRSQREPVCGGARCWCSDCGQVRGVAPLGRSVPEGVRLTWPCQAGESRAGGLAGSELHYQEYLGERISVNPNRYKDFVFLLCHRFNEKLLLLLPFLAFYFWFLFLKPHGLF